MKKSRNTPNKRAYTIELKPFLVTDCEWEVSASDDPDPTISFTFSSWERRDPAPPSVFEVREAFFEIRDLNQALAFFRKYGPWALLEGTKKASPVRFSMLAKEKAFFEEALLSREIRRFTRAANDDEMRTALEDWYLWQNLPVELVFGQTQLGLIPCKDVQEAIRASIFLDRFDREPLRRCARPDCGRFFKAGNKQSKVYCSARCAHLQSVRKYNDKKSNLRDSGAEAHTE